MIELRNDGGKIAGNSGGERRMKHIELDDAINQLGKTITKYYYLLARIRPEELSKKETEDVPKPKQNTPSLSEVLNLGPGRIISYSNALQDILQGLEEELF